MGFKIKKQKEDKKLEAINNLEEKYTVNLYTLGCRTNTYETFAMMTDLKNAGFKIVPFEEAADFSIINSCSVTNMSERKTRQVINKEKKKNPDGTYVCVGCYAQHAKPNEINADLLLGNIEKTEISKYLLDYIDKNKEKFKKEDGKRNIEYNRFSEQIVSDVFEDKKYKEFKYSANYIDEGRTRAIVKIQDGCDRFCTYCIIPYLRGRVRSREIENILNEIKEAVSDGAKEIVLTGIHMTSFGKDFGYKENLIDLLEKINEIQGVERIRIGSLEPKIITDEFIDRIKKLDKLCMQLHLSMQSGSNTVLERMKRRYTIEEYMDAVYKLKYNIPDIRITTDVIVGFPGETEEEFNETYENLKKMKLFKTHIFKYSPREGTVAAKMTGQIDGNIKNERSKKLLELNKKNALEYLQSDIGKELEVLVEQEKHGIYFGYTKNYTKVGIKKEDVDKDIINEIVKVKAKSVENQEAEDTLEIYILGEIV